MTSWMARVALGLAISGTSFAAAAANVTLTNWTFGSGNNVNLTFNNGQTYSGAAGAFRIRQPCHRHIEGVGVDEEDTAVAWRSHMPWEVS